MALGWATCNTKVPPLMAVAPTVALLNRVVVGLLHFLRRPVVSSVFDSEFCLVTINVTVLGEVKSPGSLALSANTPLVEAIFRAGGPVRWRANKNSVELIRFNRDGKVSRQTFSYNDTTNISAKNPPLRNGDTIIVNTSTYGKVLDVFRDISIPIGAASSAANSSILGFISRLPQQPSA